MDSEAAPEALEHLAFFDFQPFREYLPPNHAGIRQLNNVNTLGTHLFPEGATPRVIHQDGLTIYHHRCIRCGRDFAQGMNGGGWQAVNVGFLRVELLVNTVTDQWLAERCPGKPLWTQDAESRAHRHG